MVLKYTECMREISGLYCCLPPPINESEEYYGDDWMARDNHFPDNSIHKFMKRIIANYMQEGI